jgi:hypothetical protein
MYFFPARAQKWEMSTPPKPLQASVDAAHAALRGSSAGWKLPQNKSENPQPEAEYVRGGFNLASPTEYLRNLGQVSISRIASWADKCPQTSKMSSKVKYL